jgi:Secretion system C-terminal sorting domain/The GLUG motif
MLKKTPFIIGIILFSTFTTGLMAYSGGSGTENAPYQIDNLTDLQYLSSHSSDWDKYFVQTSDIDASATSTWDGGAGFNPIGIYPTINFTGFYNGNGHSISNLYINRAAQQQGLFGSIYAANIINLGLTSVNITGTITIGALVGHCYGISTISNCYATGTVNGSFYVGGLVGYNYDSSLVRYCYTNGTVSATSSIVGGLVAFNSSDATIENCYSNATVSGNSDRVGGLVGANYATIRNCYSTGTVSGLTPVGGLTGDDSPSDKVTNCFWDTQTSDQSSCAVGTGKTTAEMKDVTTFTDTASTGLTTAWDFLGNPNDDSADNNYWDIDGSKNSGYPILMAPNQPSYSGGSGTLDDAFQIASVSDLISISHYSDHWNKNFKQTADISFNADETQVDWDGDGSSDGSGTSGFFPIGNSTLSFTGSYNGQDHSVSYLFINSAEYLGLFGKTSEASIQDLGIIHANITGSGNYLGALVGYNSLSTISNCYSSATVSGSSSYIGALLGANSQSTLSNCYSTGTVGGESASSRIGGLVGYNFKTPVSNCYSTVTVSGVSGSNYLGGLVGYNSFSTLSKCFSLGSVNGTSDNVGGLVGMNWSSSIINSYSTEAVSGSSFVGGLVGNNDYITTPSTIENCYSTGAVSASSSLGGLVGDNHDNTTVTNSFWDSQTSGQSSSAGGTGITTAEMKDAASFTATASTGLTTAWDFAGTPNNDATTATIWGINPNENNGYPVLAWQEYDNCYYSNGLGTLGNEYEIATLDNLLYLSNNSLDWNKYFIQTADINASATSTWNGNAGFSPIGNTTTKFTGSYDGNEKTISNLYIDRSSSDYIGFFGDLNNASITDLTLSAIDISGKEYVGGFAGLAEGSTAMSACTIDDSSTIDGMTYVGGFLGMSNTSGNISDCHFSGTVTASNPDAKNSMGGFAGEKKGAGSIVESSTSGTVIGDGRNQGGFVGWMDHGQIRQCYSTASVINTSTNQGHIGGFVGSLAFYDEHNGEILNCYAKGNVSANSTDNTSNYGIGGFVGSYVFAINNKIYNSYSTGVVSADNVTNIYIGGFSGEEYAGGGGSVNCFWDMTTSGWNTSVDVEAGKTTIEMTTDALSTPNIYSTASWDFSSIWSISSTVNNSYPYLQASPPASDSATPITLTDFTAIAKNGQVILNWQTASETNNAAFLVYRNNEVIARIDGAGTSTESCSYSYVDRDIIPDVSYTYILADMDYANTINKFGDHAVTVTLVNDLKDKDFTVGNAYPNPFNPSTVIPLTLSKESAVIANLYNLEGHQVKTLINRTMNAGSHTISIDGSDMTSGIYTLMVTMGNSVDMRKIVLVK